MLTRYPDLASDMPRNVGGSDAGTERCKTDLAIIVGEMARILNLVVMQIQSLLLSSI